MTTLKSLSGAWCMVLSSIFFAGMALGVRLLQRDAPEIHVIEIVFFRGVFSALGAWVLLRRARVTWSADHPWLLIGRGLLGFFGMTTYYVAIQQLDLSPAVTVQQMNPLFAALIAWVVLGETYGWRRASWTLVALGGVVMITQPPPLSDQGDWNAFGSMAALLSAVIGGCAYVYVRWLSRREHVLRIVAWFPLVAVAGTSLLMFAVPALVDDWPIRYVWPRSAGIWLEILLVAGGTLAGQLFLTHGLTKLPAGKAMTIGMLQVPMSLGYDVLIMNRGIEIFMTTAGQIQLAGTTLVCLAVVRTVRT